MKITPEGVQAFYHDLVGDDRLKTPQEILEQLESYRKRNETNLDGHAQKELQRLIDDYGKRARRGERAVA